MTASLVLLVLAWATHAPVLPLMAWPVFALALCSRRLTRWATALRLMLLVVVVVFSIVFWGYQDPNTWRVSLLLVLALKWAESRRAREFAVLTGGALIAGTLGLLQWNEWVGLALIVLLPLCALVALEAANRPGYTIGTHLLRIFFALPLAVALFLFFPRIPGPLWDIGMTFGLPLSLWFEPDNQGLGVSTRLKPGQGQTGVGTDQPVLVAEFEHWVPPASLLYWRGPVYYDFDGQQWQLDPAFETGQGRTLMKQGWTKASRFSGTLAKKTHEISYSVRLSPHKRLWLYGLDLPSALDAESFVSADWQVLAHQPVETQMRYQIKSWLEWEAGGTLDEGLRSRALALPENGNTRLRELGKRLSNLPPEERVVAALADIAQGNFQVRDQFEFHEGPDGFDHFWFETRTGNASVYAGAFVFLMRAAGVPARLVTGYRGGKLMALTDYVIVKQNHAHAWVEIFDSPKGWRRIDPIDLVAPERFQGEGRKVQAASTSQKVPAAQSRVQEQAPQVSAPQPAASSTVAPKTPDISITGQLDTFLSRWLFRLDGEAQRNLLSSLGEKLGEKLGKTLGGGLAWVWLLLGAGLSCAVALAIHRLIEWQSELRRLPAPQRTWNRIGRLLARRGFARAPAETPAMFASRVSAAHPHWEKPLCALAHSWSDWLYAPEAPDARARIESAARMLKNLILAEAPRSQPAAR